MESFGGTARYEVIRQLGAGGMGTVYEAVDHERNGRHIAVKVLRGRDADALLRLKREFRTLADVRHENLVALHELVGEGDSWFFTLELVNGVDFLTWVRPGTTGPVDQPTAEVGATVRSPAGARGALDYPRLREAFRQLAQGVSFLHSQHLLHRDLKPSNVLVTTEGRVVILDFGLATELGGDRSISEALGLSIVGTAPYMAPEQAASGPVTAASDWYAFGVMLFQAITGRVPFEGRSVEVMQAKQLRPAPAPRELVADVPPELDSLCVALLRIEPGGRPLPSEILAVFGASPAPAPRPIQTDFIGRTAELEALRRSLAETRQGVPRLVRVIGSSGIGKSALVRRFTQEAEAEGAVVLAGRCYEREAVPFKALDSVVDALARHLAALPPERVDAILPRDAQVLARMFPVLQRVPAFRTAPARDVKEPQEQRRRAVQALRELLARMADRLPVVVVVDDAQWGDEDSAAVLEEVLRQPQAPSVLLLAAARSDTALLEGLRLSPVDLRLEPLGPAETSQLAARAITDDPERAAAVAKESGGNPFLLQQLLELARGVAVKLEDVVAARLVALAPPARKLLDVVAVAGIPVSQAAAAQAAGLDGADPDLVQTLKSAHLVRGVGEGDRLETWHDRIRETVTGLLDLAQVKDIHARLAEALLAQGTADIDTVASHLSAAGLVDKAADATISAARNAATLLAFDRAAVLFRRALELLPPAELRRREIATALGDCLADAGRGAGAAEAYRQALSEPGPRPITDGDTLELQRRAAEQLLRTGHVDEGLKAIRAVLAPLGMTLPPTPRRALLSAAFRRVHLALRGLDYIEHAEAEVQPAELRRIDVCWSVSVGLSMVDTVRANAFQTRQLLLALDSGEPYRVARALAAEASFIATLGVRAEKRAANLIGRARAIAQRVGDPRLSGLVDFCAGQTRFLAGRWREAHELTGSAEEQFRDAGAMVTWEATNARVFSVWSLFYLGELAVLSRRLPPFVREAQTRGDLYAATSLQSGLANVLPLVAGEPERAREVVRSVMTKWSAGTFHFQHYWSLLSEGMIDLYLGTPEDSWRRLEDAWPQLRSSAMLRIQNVRVEAMTLRGQLALATGRTDEAIDAAQSLEGERAGWAKAIATLLRGLASGDRHVELLRTAVDLFHAEGMALFSAAARLRLAEAQGGELGAANQRAALAWMKVQGVHEPEKLAQVIAPRATA